MTSQKPLTAEHRRATQIEARPTAETPMLSVAGLGVRAGDRWLLREVDLDVRAGEVVGLVGPNGAGKSTLLRATTGALPAAGTVTIDGCALAAYRRSDLFRSVAVVQQLPEAPAALTVGELVLLGRHPHLGLLGREGACDHEIVREAMQRAGCAAFE
ncbi:MAG: ABC transporter ATP-binding protein, partial [Dehalococcoidia bacterium]